MSRIVKYEIYEDKISEAIKLYEEYRNYVDSNRVRLMGSDELDSYCQKRNEMWDAFYQTACDSVQHKNHDIPQLLWASNPAYRTVENIKTAIEALGLNANVIEEYDV